MLKRLLAAFVSLAIVVPDYEQWGNCYLILRKIQNEGGLGILMRSKGHPDVIHVMHTFDDLGEVDVTHFQPVNPHKKDWRAFFVSPFFKGRWKCEKKRVSGRTDSGREG